MCNSSLLSPSCFFFFSEGPRSRCYGRTAALRLIVQPCDKDGQFFFSFFHVMEHMWNESDRGKPKYSGGKPVPVSLCPPQIPHGLTRDRTRVSAVTGRRLTAWATARPLGFLEEYNYTNPDFRFLWDLLKWYKIRASTESTKWEHWQGTRSHSWPQHGLSWLFHDT